MFINLEHLNIKRCQKIVELINSIDLNEAAHNELPHLDLHCLSYSF